MSKHEFKLPDIGEGVTEGEIVNWLVNEGDSISENQEMVEVMTDKATVTIGAPKTGRVAERRYKVGDTVPVGSVLVVIDLDGEPAARPSAPSGPAQTSPEPPKEPEPKTSPNEDSVIGPLKTHLPGMDPSGGAQSKPEPGTEKPLAAPATRKLARELGVDLHQVEPTGGGGRVTREDVERHAQAGTRSSEPAVPPALPRSSVEPGEERKPIRGLRKRIYENMARSKHTAAQFAYIDECDVTELKGLRERVKPHAEKQGVKLSFLPFIVKAVVAALKRYPGFNAWVDDSRQEIVLRKTYDIGIAVATEGGLIVPVLRAPDRRSILEIAREIERLANQAREGKTLREDLGGSSFTITSLGKLGGLVAPPILNYPEVGILGVHEIKRRPVVRGDEIEIGEVMLLSLCSDHRVIDGDVAARFAQEVIGLLQEPDRLLLEMS